MIPNYLFVGILLLGAVAFAVAPLFVSALLAPRKRSASKADTYECGVLPVGDSWVRFRVQYYIYALLFVIFDVETVFLYPWAVSYLGLSEAGLGLFVLVEMSIFLLLLSVALVYAWLAGDLRWV